MNFEMSMRQFKIITKTSKGQRQEGHCAMWVIFCNRTSAYLFTITSVWHAKLRYMYCESAFLSLSALF